MPHCIRATVLDPSPKALDPGQHLAGHALDLDPEWRFSLELRFLVSLGTLLDYRLFRCWSKSF